MKISVITPSLNQARFIERTIRSVLDQRGDFELEYLVVDGGSTDGTLEVLRRYGPRLTWISEPDQGQSDAINKGFRMASGDMVAWLNSDDVYEPGALAAVAVEWAREPFGWLFGDCRVIDEENREIRPFITRYKIRQSRRYSYRRLLRRDFVSQPAVFLSRKLVEEMGPVDTRLHYAMDYDYWLRAAQRCAPRYLPRFLAGFRVHAESKNSRWYRAAAWEACQVARRHATSRERLDVAFHYLHYLTLSVLYRFI